MNTVVEPDYERESGIPCPYLAYGLIECGAPTLEQGWHYAYRTDRRLVCLDGGHITELEHDDEAGLNP